VTYSVIRNKYIFKNTKSHLKLPMTDCWGRNYRTTQHNSPEYLLPPHENRSPTNKIL